MSWDRAMMNHEFKVNPSPYTQKSSSHKAKNCFFWKSTDFRKKPTFSAKNVVFFQLNPLSKISRFWSTIIIGLFYLDLFRNELNAYGP